MTNATRGRLAGFAGAAWVATDESRQAGKTDAHTAKATAAISSSLERMGATPRRMSSRDLRTLQVADPSRM
jgi:hypothetical protein